MRKPKHPTDVHVGSRVKVARIAQKLPQGALGNALDVSLQQIQKYENGNNRISASVLYDIAVFFSLPIEFFFEGLPLPEFA